MARIEQLRDAIAASQILADPRIDDGFVWGRARFPAADAEVNVNVDPELEDRPDIDVGALVPAVEHVLGMSAAIWRRIVDAVVEEIEQAVGDEDVIEKTDLRDDLAIRSVVVFVDATLLSFAAPRQFPDSWIRVQLGEDFEVDDIAVDPKDDD